MASAPAIEGTGPVAYASGWTPSERTRRKVLEPLRRRVLGPLFTRLGYDLLPAVPEWEHRPLSRREVDRLVRGAAHHIAVDLEAAGIAVPEDMEGLVRAFYDDICQCPVRQKHGGNGFNGALELFVAARALAPDVIIESGVFRGLTTWVLRKACPEARIFCFDAVFANLQHRDPAATYHEADWSGYDFGGLDLSRALAFFDDHIDQARRIIEAGERGLRHLVFDDNTAAHRIHAHGGPAFPTVDMVLADDLPTEPVRWLRNGREFVYEVDASVIGAVRERVETVRNFDDLHGVTGYSPARLTYVKLKDRRI